MYLKRSSRPLPPDRQQKITASMSTGQEKPTVLFINIGMQKLRELTGDDHCPYVLWNGSKRLIKRKPFEEYLFRQFSV